MGAYGGYGGGYSGGYGGYGGAWDDGRPPTVDERGESSEWLIWSTLPKLKRTFFLREDGAILHVKDAVGSGEVFWT